MATSTVSTIETLVRQRLVEPTPRYWASQELVDIIAAGIRDLWRATVDLKQEHYLTVDETNVSFEIDSDALSGVPNDVHKVYLIEPRDVSQTSANSGVRFTPLEYNHKNFTMARTRDPVDPDNEVFYYAIAGAGAPAGPTVIRIAPQTTSAIDLRFCYIQTLGEFLSSTPIPIPGEANNALVAWAVAYARAKERDDRSPDPSWISIYATEKQNLLESLGVRQYQEPQFVDAFFEEYW